LKIFLLVAVVVAILAILLIPHNAFVWGWGPGSGGGGWLGTKSFYYHQFGPGAGSYENGYYAGQQDAIYDHDNNLTYNPIGQCLSCHSELYWSGFHHGYDAQWNSYQAQESTQGTSINIYGNNNYVNTNQYSGQIQDQQGAGPNSDFSPPRLGCQICLSCWGSNNIPCDNEGSPDP
jgi:hypothetical protein